MVPEAPGPAASEVVRAEVSVLEASAATKEEWAGSETTSTVRHAIRSPFSRQLRANVGPNPTKSKAVGRAKRATDPEPHGGG